MTINHFVAYSNSDQASFRNDNVRRCIDFMLVPGTIATYYAEATAAFVLSSGIDYMIDPRTPLFQEYAGTPRRSHVTLAEALSLGLYEKLEEGKSNFLPGAFTDDIVTEMTRSFVEYQRTYAGRADTVQDRIARYETLLAEARGDEPPAPSQRSEGRAPAFVLAPYFAARSLDGPWWEATKTIWAACGALSESREISPVVALESVDDLEDAVRAVPDALSKTCFFWITDFDERARDSRALQKLWKSVGRLSANRSLVNLYGGYFSILMGRAGLWGFSNGLGYSESRGWPELASTGAAPPRYYVRELHMYLPVRNARALLDREPALRCDCPVCGEVHGRVDELQYHQLKEHFALARRWEIEFAASATPGALADQLTGAMRMTRGALLPAGIAPSVDFLSRWASVIRSEMM